MMIKEALRRARETLAAHNIEEAPLEAEVLLRHTLKIGRVQLYTEFQRQLSPRDEQIFQALVERRLNHEPSAYITGQRQFYGLDFIVDPGVLIPRPESELLVEKAIEWAQVRPSVTIADIGTGSGAIAVSLALSLPQARIYATDISAAALKVARLNCQQHGVVDRVHLFAGDMLEPLPGPVDLIIANLPYVREAEIYQDTLKFEPSLALNGGPDGLDKIRQLCLQAGDKLLPGGCLLLEIGQGQSDAVIAFLLGLFPSAQIEVSRDLAGIERMISMTGIREGRAIEHHCLL